MALFGIDVSVGRGLDVMQLDDDGRQPPRRGKVRIMTQCARAQPTAETLGRLGAIDGR